MAFEPAYVSKLKMNAFFGNRNFSFFSGPVHYTMTRCEEVVIGGIKFLNLSDLENRFDLPLQAAQSFIDNNQFKFAPITIGHPFVTTQTSHNSFFSRSESQVNGYFDKGVPSRICNEIPPALIDRLRIVGFVADARIDEEYRLIVDAFIDESLISKDELNHELSGQSIAFQASLHHVAMQPYEVQKESPYLQALSHLIPAEIALVLKDDTARRHGSKLIKSLSYFK